MQGANESFQLTVWLSKLTVRDWLLAVVLLLVIVGPRLFGRSKPVEPAPPPAIPPEPLSTPPSKKKRSHPKKK